jgi:DNA-binding NarL/FixJ family response regulator
MPLQLLIVDDNVTFLEAARRLFEREGMTVVGVASTVADALDRHEELRPEVTLVDVQLGEESGPDLVRALAGVSTSRPSRVIMISTYPEDDVLDLVEATPAIGFLSKSNLSGTAVLELLGDAETREDAV